MDNESNIQKSLTYTSFLIKCRHFIVLWMLSFAWRRLAQLASAHALGAWGCEFESHVSDHLRIFDISI